MPNVTFDSNTVFGARDSQQPAGRLEVSIFVRSARSYKHDKHASRTIMNKLLYRPGQYKFLIYISFFIKTKLNCYYFLYISSVKKGGKTIFRSTTKVIKACFQNNYEQI